jgi:PPP family 3-phenylpropionic acid transporter
MWHSVPLTLFWFTYMGSLGIVFPYFSLYLRENAGLSGTEMGLVLAMPPLVGIIAQPLWGQVADRTGARARTLVWLALVSAIGYLILGMANGFVEVLVATAALALFSSAILPITTSVSFAVLQAAGLHAFGYVRAWGTVGYFVVVIIFPWLLQHFQPQEMASAVLARSQPDLSLMFPATAALVFSSGIVAFFLPRKGAVSLSAAKGDWHALFRNPAYMRLLLFSLGVNLLFYGPMWLFPIFVRSRGGDVSTIRGMWIVMLVFEIPLVLSTGRGLKRLGARGLLAAGVFFGGIRWLLCAWITDPVLLYVVQALHGVTVVGLNLGGPLYLDVVTPEKLRSTAQAILSMVSVGIAGILSNAGSGWLLEHGGIGAIYWISGIGCTVLGSLVGAVLPSAIHLEGTTLTPAGTEPA